MCRAAPDVPVGGAVGALLLHGGPGDHERRLCPLQHPGASVGSEGPTGRVSALIRILSQSPLQVLLDIVMDADNEIYEENLLIISDAYEVGISNLARSPSRQRGIAVLTSLPHPS